MSLTDIYWDLRGDINKIEKSLETAIAAQHDILQQASSRLLRAGGKRIRPVFVLLAAKFGHYDIEKINDIAVPLELIHMGSLVHDDVIDDADLRRGKKTVKSRWDNRVAVYAGDYIFSQAITRATNCHQPEVHQLLANAMVEMCIGEIEQIRTQYEWNQQLRMYLRKIKRKTALLIAISCRLGAVVAEAPKEIQMKLYRYGYFVGMSFQITDDVLDFVASEKQLGKPAGSDLKNGNVTLPALYAMCRDDQLKEMINATIMEDCYDEVVLPEIITRIKNSGGIEYSLELSDLYLNKAFAELEKLPDIHAKESFYKIAQYIGTRKY
ncbi:MAG: heptaprenyl diphosphate synthase component II [Bacillaceae bacterium]|nr:heptaprenyl diphosphate synthase component II [Bacillaceae bacterium]